MIKTILKSKIYLLISKFSNQLTNPICTRYVMVQLQQFQNSQQKIAQPYSRCLGELWPWLTLYFYSTLVLIRAIMLIKFWRQQIFDFMLRVWNRLNLAHPLIYKIFQKKEENRTSNAHNPNFHDIRLDIFKKS